MNRQMISDHLELAKCHVADATTIIWRQRRLIKELTSRGRGRADPYAIIEMFEGIQARHVADRGPASERTERKHLRCPAGSKAATPKRKKYVKRTSNELERIAMAMRFVQRRETSEA